MRLAVISDIHGNSLALAAVLADIRAEGADAIVCLGDIVSGPLDPAGTAEMLTSLGCVAVAGNHDRWIFGDAPDLIDRFAGSRLSPAHRQWLSDLPATQVVDDEVFLCHGTPTSDEMPWLDNFYAGRRTELPDEAAVAAHAEGFDFPVLLCGHTHIARCVRLKDGRLIVNPGAVGLQFVIGSPDARYALLDRRDGQWSVSLRTVPYDRAGAADQAARNGFAQWRDVLMHGWDGPEGLF